MTWTATQAEETEALIGQTEIVTAVLTMKVDLRVG